MNTEKKFLDFHEDNPHVYEALRELVVEAQTRGYAKWGIGGMYEILRWRGSVVTSGDPHFKLRNDFRAYYSRLLLLNGDAPVGFFSLRRSQADTPVLLEEELVGDESEWSEWEEEWS
jgi:hypothetical protein